MRGAVIILSLLIMAQGASAADKLLQPSDFVYKGAFRLPQGSIPNSVRSNALAYATASIAFRPPTSGAPNGSLYIVARDALVAEVTIPAVKNPKDPVACPTGLVSCLNTAAWKQGPMDLTQGNLNTNYEGHTAANTWGAASMDTGYGGLLYYNNKLIGSVIPSYDNSSHGPWYTHFTANPTWDVAAPASPSFAGLYKVNAYTTDATRNAGMTGGYMATIPASWQAPLGGKVLTGWIRESIISAGSYGPTLASFDPDALTGSNSTVAAANLLVAYPANNVFFNWPATKPDGFVAPQPRGSMNLRVRGAAFPEGSKTVVVFGSTGLGITGQGESCYGEYTGDITEVKSLSEITAWWNANGHPASYSCGGKAISIDAGTGGAPNPCCWDPVGMGKGQKSYPYIARAWLYSADDLAAVKSGSKTYDSVVPYAQWDLDSYTITPYRTWDYNTNMLSTVTNPSYSYTRNNGPNDLPFAPQADQIVGAAYDPATQRVYLSQLGADKPGSEPFSVIHVFEVASTTATTPSLIGKLIGTIR